MKKGFLVFLLFITAAVVQAQICNNATDTVYSLNSITGSGSGQIIGVNVNNAGTKLIGTPPASSANANGAGFSQVTGLFYFFNQCAAGTTEFVSFNPLTGSKVPKVIPGGAFPAGPVIPTASTGKIRSGTVNKNGTGYYTIFPGATTAMGYPSSAPAFLYYSIGANSWTCITQKFKDVSGNIVTPLQSLNSGDMAFDGNDNLWILCSSSASYSLYRIRAPLPTTYLGSTGFVTVDTMIPVTATPGGVSFTGIAFNAAGKLFLSTGSYSSPPGVAGNNQLYYLSSLTSPLVTVGTLPNGYGDDLTSCSFPLQVLASHWIDFKATNAGNGVNLHWKVDEEINVTGYDIEHSNDADHWNVGGVSAKTYYENAIAADMATYSLYPATSAIPAADVTAYINDPAVLYNSTDALKLINTQYWIVNIRNGTEAFANFRRSGYPALTPNPVVGVLGSPGFARRLSYPDAEASANTANYNAAAAAIGGDKLTSRVFWDIP